MRPVRIAPGDLLAGRYRIKGVVGEGGMSTVYRADDVNLHREVAIKVFRPELASPEDIRRQQDEIRMIAGLSHPSLVTLFDAVADEEAGAFLVMQYVAGQDLRSRLTSGPLAPGTLAGIGADVASALAYLSDRNVVHRDVKPANILLTSPGDHGARALIADFGIARIVDAARLTATGSVIGTASYLSPEQALGRSADASSDVYSLGLVLIEGLTGVRCFPGTPAEAIAARLSTDPVVPDGFGESWAGLLTSMTLRTPGERISAGDAAAALGDLGGATTGDEATLRFPTADLATEVLAPGQDETPGDLSEEPTERFSPARESVGAGESPPAPKSARDGRARRWPQVALVSAVVSAAAVIVALAFGLWASGPSATPAPDDASVDNYPAVDGTLGDHLEQLQRSVAP